MPGPSAYLTGLTPALADRIPAMAAATSQEGAFQVADLLAVKPTALSYVGTATGGTTAPTPTVNYAVNGNVVTIDLPAITFTSNATTFTLTGGPVGMRPATVKVVPVRVADNSGAISAGYARVELDGSITFFTSAALGAFTAAGTKQLAASSFSYTLA